MDAAAPLIEVKNLRRTYMVAQRGSRAKPLHAVDGVDLAVRPRETVGLIGESGSGKSTLGRTMLRLQPSNAGQILFDGDDITHVKGAGLRQLRRRMNLVFQNPYSAVNRRRRIGDIIREPLDSFSIGTSAERTARAFELLDMVGLPRAQAERYPHELSGGQLQRVVIARAVATKPAFLVADEPTASLDMSVRAQVINLMLELREELDLAMVFISHDLRTVSHVSDEIAVLYLGAVVEKGPARELERDPLHPYTRNLIDALPKLQHGARHLAPAVGEVPSALNLPTGCRYSARCPIATAVCREVAPVLEEKRPGRLVACHEVGTSIPAP